MQVSAVDSHADGNAETVELRYYDRKEYMQLTDGQKKKLKELREKGKGGGGGKQHKGQGKAKAHKASGTDFKKKYQAARRQISTLKTKLKGGGSDSSEDDDEVPMNDVKDKGSNRTNPALQRNKTRK